jgi:hypothetical protein
LIKKEYRTIDNVSGECIRVNRRIQRIFISRNAAITISIRNDVLDFYYNNGINGPYESDSWPWNLNAPVYIYNANGHWIYYE